MTNTDMLRNSGTSVDPNKWMKPEDIVDYVLFLLRQSNRVIVKDIIPWAAKHDEI